MPSQNISRLPPKILGNAASTPLKIHMFYSMCWYLYLAVCRRRCVVLSVGFLWKCSSTDSRVSHIITLSRPCGSATTAPSPLGCSVKHMVSTLFTQPTLNVIPALAADIKNSQEDLWTIVPPPKNILIGKWSNTQHSCVCVSLPHHGYIGKMEHTLPWSLWFIHLPIMWHHWCEVTNGLCRLAETTDTLQGTTGNRETEWPQMHTDSVHGDLLP
jgi:hypothetical protein